MKQLGFWHGVIITCVVLSILFMKLLELPRSNNTPIKSKSPIDPELHIVVKDGELDTTWVYVRNIEQP